MTPFEAQDFARRKLFAAVRQSERAIGSRKNSRLPPVLVLSDPDRTPDILSLAHQIPRGWALVYRHFGHPQKQDIIRQLDRISRRRRFILIVSTDSNITHLTRHHGVHWPKHVCNAPPKRQRAQFHTTSAHDHGTLARAARNKMDACLVSAVFPSKSPSAPTPMGAIRFRLLAQKSSIPLYALGGVSHKTAGQVAICAGLSGIESFLNILKKRKI